MKVLVTGAAGFIGMHVAKHLLERGDEVHGLDNLNDYYDPALKQARLARLQAHPGFRFHPIDIADGPALASLCAAQRFERVVHLAAQAGVRHSIEQPLVYGHSNLTGFLQVLEACRRGQVGHLVYASSSSVYGCNSKMPFCEDDRADEPVSLYAATKRANELMAHAYSHLYRIPTTGLRFFTVYGPWGRPDMAYYSFTRDILAGRTIDVYNHGRMQRDFTYVDDMVAGLVGALDRPPVDPGNAPPIRLYNIGNHRPEPLLDLIRSIEAATGHEAQLRYLPMQSGDVPATYADVDRLSRDVGFAPTTPLREGIARFVDWYLDYHRPAQAASGPVGAAQVRPPSPSAPCAAPPAPTSAAAGRRSPGSLTVPLRGLDCHLNTWGPPGNADGVQPPLVLLHGWMDVGASFQFLVEALRTPRRVIAPDWRGFGRSTRSGADSYWFPDYLGDLDALLDHLSPGQPVDLLGHSMGGNIAMLYAGVRPHRVRRLVNLEGFGLPDSQPEEAPERYARWLDELRQPQTLRDFASLAEVADRLRRNNPRLSAERAAWLAPHWAREAADGRWVLEGDPAHKRSNPVLYRAAEALACWRRITAPVLWVEGRQTEVARHWGDRYPREAFEQRLGVVPHCERLVLEDAGHMLHHDQPEQLAAALEDFLDRP